MKKDTLVRILGGPQSRQNKIAIVIEAKGTGKNAGQVEVSIEGLGNFWYEPQDLEPISLKTKLGDRIVITYVPSAITNVKVEQEGVVIKEPEVFLDSIRVRIKLDDGQTILWLEDNLEVTLQDPLIRKIELYFRSDRSESKQIELIERNCKTYAKVKDLRKHPLNDLIYSKANVEKLLSQIKRKDWIKTLTIKPDGTIVSGNTRHECAEILNWEEVEVEIEEFEFKWQEVTRVLMENDYRTKTREEKGREGIIWEWSEKEEAAERRRATQNNKSNVDEGADMANLPLQTEKSTKKGKTRDRAAEQVGLKSRNYEKIKKVIVAADRLDAEDRKGAAKKLLDTLNNKSTNAAYKQIKELDRVKDKIASLKQNEQLKEAEELNTILKNHNVKEAVFLMNTWERERRKKEAKLSHNDVVRIKGKEHQGEWAILDIYDEDKETGIIQTVLGDFHEQLVNLEKIQLSSEEKTEARLLMERLQQASYQLQTMGESLGHKIIQDLLKKPNPLLNEFEESMVQTIENFGENRRAIDPAPEEFNVNNFLNTFIKNLDRIGVEDIRVIARAIGQNKPEFVKELIKTFAKNKDTARLMASELKLLHPDLLNN